MSDSELSKLSEKQRPPSKLQLFENIMETLESESPAGSVKGELIISELIKTGRFTELQARTLTKKISREGHLFEPKSGYFKRTQ